jgi:RsmE family RNA methyltransferase
VNLLLLDAVTPTLRLAADDPRLEHVRGVLRARVGDTLCVGAVNGPRGEATVTASDAQGLALQVQWEEQAPPPPPALDLLIGLPRPATARKILTEAATLGVRSLRFVATAKTDPAYARSQLWQAGGWEPALRLGAEQAFTTRLPEVFAPEPLEAALARLAPSVSRLALDVYEADRRLGEALPTAPPVVLALGPERGWGAADRVALRAAGCELVHLGERVLRVETAVTVALALTYGAWGLF